VKTASPLGKGRKILFIAGNGNAGTHAALLAFLNRFDDLVASEERGRVAHVVEGKDLDSDGVVDHVEFIE